MDNEIRKALRATWQCKATTEDNWTLTRNQRWFYTFKAIVCLLLNRCGDFSEGVCVGAYGGHSYLSYDCHNAYAWTAVIVGHGVFKDWYHCISDDSNC